MEPSKSSKGCCRSGAAAGQSISVGIDLGAVRRLSNDGARAQSIIEVDKQTSVIPPDQCCQSAAAKTRCSTEKEKPTCSAKATEYACADKKNACCSDTDKSATTTTPAPKPQVKSCCSTQDEGSSCGSMAKKEACSSKKSACCSTQDEQSSCGTVARKDACANAKSAYCSIDTDENESCAVPAVQPKAMACSSTQKETSSCCTTKADVVPRSACSNNTGGCCSKDEQKAMAVCDEERASCCKTGNAVPSSTADGCDTKVEPASKDCCKVSEALTSKPCCEESEDDDEYDDKDDYDDGSTVCDCCVPVLLFVSPDEAQRRREAATATDDDAKEALRKCCQITLQECCKDRTRCDATWQESKQSHLMRGSRTASKAIDDDKGDAVLPGQTHNLSSEKSVAPEHKKQAETPLQLVLGGMDCADCAPRVIRAVERLQGARVINLDYFQGRCELVYVAEIIEPDTIAKFVARATGFEVKVVTADSQSQDAGPGSVSNTAALSYHFDNAVIAAEPKRVADLLRQWDVRIINNRKGQTVSVSFSASGPAATAARDVHEAFSAAGGVLLPDEQTTGSVSVVRRDAVKVAVRVAISIALCVPTLVLTWAPLPHNGAVRYEAASLALVTLLLINSYPMLQTSIRSIVFLHQADLMVLVSVSIFVAWAYSTASFFVRLSGYQRISKPFFETVALLITLVYIGRLAQAATRLLVVTEVRGLKPNSETATLTLLSTASRDGSGQTIDVRLLQHGDVIVVPPEASIVIDGVVAAGCTGGAVDESFITGESLPVHKPVGARIFAGSRNLDTQLHIQVTRLVHETSLVSMSHSVSRAFSSRSTFQELSDRMAAVLLPVAIACASIAFLVWALVERLVRGSYPSVAATVGLDYAIAVLVVSCPCPLALSVPLVTSLSILTGVKEGVLFRSSEALYHAAHATVFAFDKTGTLSTGTFEVIHSVKYVDDSDALVIALTSNSSHPVAQSVLAHVRANTEADIDEQQQVNVQDVKAIPGKGLTATLHGYAVRAGSVSFTKTEHFPDVAALIDAGMTTFVITVAGSPVVLYGLQDQPKPEAYALVAALRASNKTVSLISGDNGSAARRFAASVGIDAEHVHAPCLPEQKAEVIASLQKRDGRARKNVVAFVGDGTNDAIAFGAADVSLALASGSDIACATADVLLLVPNVLRGVEQAVRLARVSHRFNAVGLAWCAVYAFCAILLATGATVEFSLEPRWAGLGEVVSVLPIVALGFSLPVYWRLFCSWKEV